MRAVDRTRARHTCNRQHAQGQAGASKGLGGSTSSVTGADDDDDDDDDTPGPKPPTKKVQPIFIAQYV